MTGLDYTIQKVTHIGGPLDGTVNALDYAQWELEEMIRLGEVWDYTPAHIQAGAADVIERYKPEFTDGQWIMRHVGVFDRPVLERVFRAAFIGGPRDGDATTFLGTIRDRLWLASSHFPGYRLVHNGSEPLEGWQMLPTEKTWQQVRDEEDAS